jgi:hypothetical protein
MAVEPTALISRPLGIGSRSVEYRSRRVVQVLTTFTFYQHLRVRRQLAIALDSGGGMVELLYTVYGRATGTSQIAGDALITTTAASSKVELRNPAGNTPALTITPLAGGTHPAVASVVIQQLS